MTDNEIIKALECCASGADGCEKDCPLSKECDSPIKSGEKIMQSALDLINRLQAENKFLSNHFLYSEAKREEMLFSQKVELCRSIELAIATAKAEAYKECIEKVKEHSNKTELVCSGALVRTDYTITKENLDNLLKELVGEKDV